MNLILFQVTCWMTLSNKYSLNLKDSFLIILFIRKFHFKDKIFLTEDDVRPYTYNKVSQNTHNIVILQLNKCLPRIDQSS